MINRKSVVHYLSILLCLLPTLVEASVQVSGTRFIYASDSSELIVDLTNNSNQPALIQSWLDSGDAMAPPGSEELPFIIRPPMARIEPHQGQSLRIAAISNSLPRDRESVFWLNVLDIPPETQQAHGANIVQLAFRSRLKLFYRPSDLPGSPSQAAHDIHWTLIPDQQGYRLRAYNASRYYVSFSEVSLLSGGQHLTDIQAGMVAPDSYRDFFVNQLSSPPSDPNIEGVWINDFGATVPEHYTLAPPPTGARQVHTMLKHDKNHLAITN